jgi:hypothetical protein
LSITFEGGEPASLPLAVTPLMGRLTLHVSACALLKLLELNRAEETINIVIQIIARANFGAFFLESPSKKIKIILYSVRSIYKSYYFREKYDSN